MSEIIVSAREVEVPAGSIADAEARIHVALNHGTPNVQLLLKQILMDLAIVPVEQNKAR